MKAAELFVRCLENEGVQYLFGLPGEENLDIMDALLESSIKFVTTRHEQAAAFMADVYGRLTCKAGVCLATLGPGATNLMTGVADANMDHAPVVAISGQSATTHQHKESHQYLDLVNLFRPISKYAAQIIEPETIPEVVRKAFKQAQTGRFGRQLHRFSGKRRQDGHYRLDTFAVASAGAAGARPVANSACRRDDLQGQVSDHPGRQRRDPRRRGRTICWPSPKSSTSPSPPPSWRKA